MDREFLELLADPLTGEPLEYVKSGAFIVNPSTGRRYPVKNGIPLFITDEEITGRNLKYRKLYDTLAPFYDFPYRAYDLLSRGGERRVRMSYLKELEVEANSKVLEVSIGTGANLRLLPGTARFFGLDISWGMLSKCRKNLKRWDIDAGLVLGQAEALPFKDAAFDVVFHMGGINFFNDKGAAIMEMIRVAKHGTKIAIVDETETYAKKSYERTPLVRNQFRNRSELVLPPVDLLPPDMLEVNFEHFWDGRLYCLTFRKP